MFNIDQTERLDKKENLELGYLGLEPRTIRLKADYSTIELITLR